MYVIDNELYHHGVIGMKWGIRRYQPYSIGYDAEHKGRFVGLSKEHRAIKKQAKETYRENRNIIKQQRKEALRKAGFNLFKRARAHSEADAQDVKNKAEYYKAIGNERKEKRQYINAMKRQTVPMSLDIRANALALPRLARNKLTKDELKEQLTKEKGSEYVKSVTRRALGETIATAAAGVAIRQLGKKYIQNWTAVKANNVAIESLGLNEVEAPKGKGFTTGRQAIQVGENVLNWAKKHRSQY